MLEPQKKCKESKQTSKSRWHFQDKNIGVIRVKNIRIYRECGGGIEKSVPRITDWHHEACRVMTISDCEGRIFLSHPHTNNGFFFLLTTEYLILYMTDMKRLPENPELTEMQHSDVFLILQ